MNEWVLYAFNHMEMTCTGTWCDQPFSCYCLPHLLQ